jgi:hypothetical protein
MPMNAEELRKQLAEAVTHSKSFTLNSTLSDVINEAVKSEAVPPQKLGALFCFRWGTLWSD